MAKTTGKNTGKKTTQAKAAPQKVAAKADVATKVTKATKATKAPKTVAPAKTTQTAKSTKRATKTVSKTPKAVTQKAGNVADQESAATRYYKMITIEQNDQGENMAVCKGRYSGKKPRQASSKGCTKLFRAYNDKEEQYPESIIFGMHECTRSRKKKKKFFYIGTKEDLEAPQEVPIHQKGDDGKYLFDKSGNKVPKLDPNSGEPLVIRYRTNSKVKKLFCPEKKDKVETDGERKTVVRALTAEEFGELENPPYTFAEYQNIHANFVLLRNYDAPEDDEDEEAENAENVAPKAKKVARAPKATKTTKATKVPKVKATKATKVVKATKATKAPKKATPKQTETQEAVPETQVEVQPQPEAPVVEAKTPVVNKNSKNLTVKKNTANAKKPAAPKKAVAAAKKAGKKPSVKKN